MKLLLFFILIIYVQCKWTTESLISHYISKYTQQFPSDTPEQLKIKQLEFTKRFNQTRDIHKKLITLIHTVIAGTQNSLPEDYITTFEKQIYKDYHQRHIKLIYPNKECVWRMNSYDCCYTGVLDETIKFKTACEAIFVEYGDNNEIEYSTHTRYSQIIKNKEPHEFIEKFLKDLN